MTAALREGDPGKRIKISPPPRSGEMEKGGNLGQGKLQTTCEKRVPMYTPKDLLER